jgi:hypothetical protein
VDPGLESYPDPSHDARGPGFIQPNPVQDKSRHDSGKRDAKGVCCHAGSPCNDQRQKYIQRIREKQEAGKENMAIDIDFSIIGWHQIMFQSFISSYE